MATARHMLCAGDVRCQEGYRFIYTFAPVEWPRAKALHETSIGLAVKELEEDAEAKEAIGSHGGEQAFRLRRTA